MKISYIELAGEKHPMCFSLSATEDIIEAFGSIEAMSEAVTNDDMLAKLRAVDKTLEVLLRAGRTYCSAMGEQLPAPLPCRPADLIDVTSGEAVRAIFDTMRHDSAREVEVTPKNAQPTQA